MAMITIIAMMLVRETHSSSNFCSETFELVQRPHMQNLSIGVVKFDFDFDDDDDENLLEELKSVTTNKV